MALCLFGGAFNPPHRTHERVIRAALEQLPVDRVVVLPTGQHPLKSPAEMAPAAARVELARVAFASLPAVTVDDWETRQEGRSYTVDTLRHFREYEGRSGRPYWILGSDNLKILTSWHRYRDVLELATIVTCPRMGYPVDASTLDALALSETQRQEILDHVLDVEPDDVAATEIRAAIRAGRDTSTWLRSEVRERIDDLALYREDERA